jgi:hypothetical protein
MSKAGILDRVMEVVNEVDEDDLSSTGDRASKNGSRRSSMTPSIPETANQQIQQPTFMVTSATMPDLAKEAESQTTLVNGTPEPPMPNVNEGSMKEVHSTNERILPVKQEEASLNTVRTPPAFT